MTPLSKTAADFSRQLGAAVATLTDASAVKMCYGALNTKPFIRSADNTIFEAIFVH